MRGYFARIYLSRRERGKVPGVFTGILAALLLLPACTGVNTFPMSARAGDTVSVMVGGSEKARKETISVSLTDAASQTWDLKSLGLVRSVFNLRMDGRAYGSHYSPYPDSDFSWSRGHEPVQTVLVADLPTNAAPGNATLSIALNATDNSSGISDPFTVKLEILQTLPGSGSVDQFLRKNYQAGGPIPADFSRLEASPHAKISFSMGTTVGAASLTVSFNSAVLNGKDINVYVPESTVRNTFSNPDAAFGDTQRIVYWWQNGQNLYIDVVAPQGIDARYLKLYLVHPRNLSGPVNFNITGSVVYDVNSNVITTTPTLDYFP